MGTITDPTPVMWEIVEAWEAEYPSAVFSGINGDAPHQTKPGKHLSWSQNKDKFGSGCWPLEAPNDKNATAKDKAIAIDMSMSTADMKTCHNRFKAIYNNRANDPRAKYLYAFNGWDGNNGAGRYNLYKGTIDDASDDHKWHEHMEGYYLFVNDPEFARAIISAIRGETIAEYTGEDDMTRDELFDALDDWVQTRYGAKPGTAEEGIKNMVSAWGWIYKDGGLPPGHNMLSMTKNQFGQVDAITKTVDISAEELQAIEDAAREGAASGAADAEAIADLVVQKLEASDTGLTESQKNDVKQASKEAYTEVTQQGTNSVIPAPPSA